MSFRLGAVAFFVAFFVATFVASIAAAHLMPAGKGTLNVVGSKAYIVLSLPVGALSQDRLPRLTPATRSALREQVRRNVRVSSGGQQAVLEEVLFSRSTDDEHLGQQDFEETHGDGLVVMIVARFAAPPTPIELTSALWTAGFESLEIQATESEGATTLRSERDTLTRSEPSVLFFASTGEVFTSALRRGFLHLVDGFDHLLFVILVLLFSVSARRWTKVIACLALSFGCAFCLVAFWPAPSLDVEVAIAASLLIVAAAYLARPFAARVQWWVIAVLGLIHGLGFAGTVIRPAYEDHLPWIKAFGFYLGANLGLAIVAVLVGVVVLIGRRGIGKSFVPKLAQAPPLIGGAAGIYWVIIRALF